MSIWEKVGLRHVRQGGRAGYTSLVVFKKGRKHSMIKNMELDRLCSISVSVTSELCDYKFLNFSGLSSFIHKIGTTIISIP